MISYRTLVFGTIAVIAAAAPAYADSVAAVPGPVHTMDSVAAVPKPMDSVAAVPKVANTSTTTTHTSFVTTLAQTFVQFEDFVLRISL